MKKLLIPFAFLLFFMVSCKKDKDEVGEKKADFKLMSQPFSMFFSVDYLKSSAFTFASLYFTSLKTIGNSCPLITCVTDMGVLIPSTSL